jgi:hypothetical protein
VPIDTPTESSAPASPVSPSTILDGMMSGAEGGSNDATVASVDDGSPIALMPMMNDPTIKSVRGVIVLWRSSCRFTIEPATANKPA